MTRPRLHGPVEAAQAALHRATTLAADLSCRPTSLGACEEIASALSASLQALDALARAHAVEDAAVLPLAYARLARAVGDARATSRQAG